MCVKRILKYETAHYNFTYMKINIRRVIFVDTVSSSFVFRFFRLKTR